MKNTWWNGLVVLAALAMTSQAAFANEKLGDLMGLLSDQLGGITETSKKEPADVSPAAFNRTISRARVGQWLVSVALERKGEVKDGKLVPAEFSVDKIKNAEGEAAVKLDAEYVTWMGTLSTQFKNAEAELKAQAALTEGRDFTALKAATAALGKTMQDAHKIFRK